VKHLLKGCGTAIAVLLLALSFQFACLEGTFYSNLPRSGRFVDGEWIILLAGVLVAGGLIGGATAAEERYPARVDRLLVLAVVAVLSTTVGSAAAGLVAEDDAEQRRTRVVDATLVNVARDGDEDDYDVVTALDLDVPIDGRDPVRVTFIHPDDDVDISVSDEEPVAVAYDPDDPDNMALADAAGRGLRQYSIVLLVVSLGLLVASFVVALCVAVA
jgi:hypothetical protein